MPSHSASPAKAAPEPASRPGDAGTVIAGSNAVAAAAAAPPLVDFGSRYRVETMLGEGGMGAVYKAYDLELDRMVALKLVRPELTRDPGVYQRFKQELLLASRISHKNILRTHDLGEAPGIKFISMAYVDGQDLRQLIVSQGKLPVDRAVTATTSMPRPHRASISSRCRAMRRTTAEPTVPSPATPALRGATICFSVGVKFCPNPSSPA